MKVKIRKMKENEGRDEDIILIKPEYSTSIAVICSPTSLKKNDKLEGMLLFLGAPTKWKCANAYTCVKVSGLISDQQSAVSRLSLRTQKVVKRLVYH